ncbi:MAG: signal peptidase I [Planctomycetota bacterium]
MSRRTRIRRALFLVLAVLVLAALFFPPVRVEGDSMEPALLAGDRLLLVPPALRAPRRFDLVVVAEPDTGKAAVKRVAGLPGERIQLIEDDLFVDGRRLVRPVRGIRDLVPLYDLSEARAEEVFKLAEGGFHLAGGAWELDGPGEAWMRTPPMDGYRTDGKHVEGRRPATDLGIEAAFRMQAAGAHFGVFIREDAEQFALVLEDGGRSASLFRGGRPRVLLDRRELSPPAARGRLFLSNHDRTLTTALDGRPLFEPLSYVLAEERPMKNAPPGFHAVQVGFGGGGPLAVEEIRVGRDLVADPAGTYACGQVLQLGREEYFLLGDNHHASRDSRQYGAVSGERLQGVVVGRLWPPGSIGLGWGH